MEKKLYIDKHARKELRSLNETVQERFEAYLTILREKGKLELPAGKKIKRNLFEMRVSFEGIFRGFYAYIGKNGIIILHIFRKKTQKTPIKNLTIAERRLKNYG